MRSWLPSVPSSTTERRPVGDAFWHGLALFRPYRGRESGAVRSGGPRHRVGTGPSRTVISPGCGEGGPAPSAATGRPPGVRGAAGRVHVGACRPSARRAVSRSGYPARTAGQRHGGWARRRAGFRRCRKGRRHRGRCCAVDDRTEHQRRFRGHPRHGTREQRDGRPGQRDAGHDQLDHRAARAPRSLRGSSPSPAS